MQKQFEVDIKIGSIREDRGSALKTSLISRFKVFFLRRDANMHKDGKVSN